MNNYIIIKRGLDIIFSFILLLIFLPLIILLYFLFLIFSGRPVFFIQKRIGKNGKLFDIYKFRTMVLDAIDLQKKGKNNDYVSTKIGRVMRPLHLDELPQLFNILKGDMSFIGYRPIVAEYEDYLKKYEDLGNLHKVRPGFTGMSSILQYIDKDNRTEFLKEFNFNKKDFAYDPNHYIEAGKYYSNNLSFLLDLKIIYWTLILEVEALFNKNE